MTRLKLLHLLRCLGFKKLVKNQDILLSYMVIKFTLYCSGLSIKHIKGIIIDEKGYLIIFASNHYFETEYNLYEE